MVEIRELSDRVEVIAAGFREMFNSRFKAIMAAHALALAESELQGGRQVDIVVLAGWGEGYVIQRSTDRSFSPDANCPTSACQSNEAGRAWSRLRRSLSVNLDHPQFENG
ncbi:hypothetical protein [Luteimonas mephitis]|uniref:hypothetical protein n=1 Tax=Luteimonas mephitis TaxID=83615 RepID=UPI0012EB7B7F|nr:hypothetical protein [Luteimonas mephitis]